MPDNSSSSPLCESFVDTPIGPLRLLHREGVLHVARFEKEGGEGSTCPPEIAGAFHKYFSGDFAAFATLPLHTGGTGFEEKVWGILRRIPPGTTCTYKDIAMELGGRRYSHAVGNAVGRNRLAVVIPCHRVIGSDGGLTGYAWGLPRKEWLLHHEGWRPAQGTFL